MTTELNGRQIKDSSIPSSKLESPGGLTIYETTLIIPAKTNGRGTINIIDAGMVSTNKIFIQNTLAGEENEEDEKEIQIICAIAQNGSFDITFETFGYVVGEFNFNYLIF